MRNAAFVVDFESDTVTFGFEADDMTIPLPAELASAKANCDRITLYPQRHEAVARLPRRH